MESDDPDRSLRPESGPAPIPGEWKADPPVQRALEDVLEDEARSVRRSLGAAGGDGLAYEGLASAIEGQGPQFVPSEASSMAVDSGEVARQREGGAGLGTAELTELMRTCAEVGSGPFIDAEALSLERSQILMHVAAEGLGLMGRGAYATRAMTKRVEAALADADPARAMELVAAAVPDMAETLEPEVFDRWMEVGHPFVARVFDEPIEALVAMAVAAGPSGRENLVPHVVDEYLLLLPRRMPPLDARVFELAPEALDRVWERLGRLRAFGQGLMQRNAFRVGDRFTQDLFHRLAASPLVGPLTPALMEAFFEALPADRGARACVLAKREACVELASVLGVQLANIRSPLPLEAQRVAAMILVDELESLPEERREEPWIADGVAWLGERDASRDPAHELGLTRALLERLATERRGLVRAWPRDVRRAAKSALRALPSAGRAAEGGSEA